MTPVSTLQTAARTSGQNTAAAEDAKDGLTRTVADSLACHLSATPSAFAARRRRRKPRIALASFGAPVSV